MANRVLWPGPRGGAKALESSVLPVEFGDFAAKTGHFGRRRPGSPLRQTGWSQPFRHPPLYAGNVPAQSPHDSPQSFPPMLVLAGSCRRRGGRRAAGPGILALLLTAGFCLAIGGCSHLRGKPAGEYVYVTAKQTFLRDRVAAVSNRTGTVENGQRLEVLERGRRFFRVKTEKGEVGWIDEKAVATQEVFDAFQALGESHKGDSTVASAVVRDEVNLHLKPGRETERFYRLAEGEKM